MQATRPHPLALLTGPVGLTTVAVAKRTETGTARPPCSAAYLLPPIHRALIHSASASGLATCAPPLLLHPVLLAVLGLCGLASETVAACVPLLSNWPVPSLQVTRAETSLCRAPFWRLLCPHSSAPGVLLRAGRATGFSRTDEDTPYNASSQARTDRLRVRSSPEVNTPEAPL